MDAYDRERLLSALTLLVMALFVGSGMRLSPPWRRRLRIAAVAGFVITTGLALAEIALWWTGFGR